MLDIQFLLLNFLDDNILNELIDHINDTSNKFLEDDMDTQLYFIRLIKNSLITNIWNDMTIISDYRYNKLFWVFWHKEIIKNITIKISNNGLINFVYNSKIQVLHMWTVLTLSLRWIVLDIQDNFKIISFPFNKFFNVNEFNISNANYETLLNTHENIWFTVLEKLDWALWQLFNHRWEYKIITKGGFNNLEWSFATKWFNDNINVRNKDIKKFVDNNTLIFEIITPNDFFQNNTDNADFSHIIDYEDYQWIVLIWCRNKNTYELYNYNELLNIWKMFDIDVVKEIVSYDSFEDMYSDIHDSMEKTEWVVLYFNNWDIFKLKTKFYLIEQYRRNWLSDKKIIKAIKSKKFDELLEKTPEELHWELYDKLDNIKETFKNTYINPALDYYFWKVYWLNIDKKVLYEQVRKDLNNSITQWLILSFYKTWRNNDNISKQLFNWYFNNYIRNYK